MKHFTPQQAWAWLQAESEQRAARGEEPPLFVDVRMEIESLYDQAWDGCRKLLGASHPRLQTIKCGKEYVRRCKLRCRPVRAGAD